jgi:hypothetical protein
MEPRLQNLPVECEYVGGHLWSDPIPTENALGQPILLVVCVHCHCPQPAETVLSVAA